MNACKLPRRKNRAYRFASLKTKECFGLRSMSDCKQKLVVFNTSLADVRHLESKSQVFSREVIYVMSIWFANFFNEIFLS